MLTTSQDIPGSGSPFQHQDPLAQLSRVPYDRLDRFQLSKVATALGIKHRPGEKHEVLVRLLGMGVEMRKLSNQKIMDACRKVLIDERAALDASRGALEPEDDPFEAMFNTPAPAAPAPAAPTTDAVLAFALLPVAEKRQTLKELGVRFATTDNAAALLAKWRETTGN